MPLHSFVAPLRRRVRFSSKIKAPGMADMPGESQEEPSVMVVAITCDNPSNLDD
jgi:hypothetical protein